MYCSNNLLILPLGDVFQDLYFHSTVSEMNPEPDFRDSEHTQHLQIAFCIANESPTVCGDNFLFHLPFILELSLDFTC